MEIQGDNLTDQIGVLAQVVARLAEREKAGYKDAVVLQRAGGLVIRCY